MLMIDNSLKIGLKSCQTPVDLQTKRIYEYIYSYSHGSSVNQTELPSLLPRHLWKPEHNSIESDMTFLHPSKNWDLSHHIALLTLLQYKKNTVLPNWQSCSNIQSIWAPLTILNEEACKLKFDMMWLFPFRNRDRIFSQQRYKAVKSISAESSMKSVYWSDSQEGFPPVEMMESATICR